MPTERTRPKRDEGSLGCSLGRAGHLVVVRKVHVIRVDLFVQYPSVRRARVKEGSYLLCRFISNVYVCDIGKVHMIVKVETKATTSLLRVLIKLTLIHIRFLLFGFTRLIILHQTTLILLLLFLYGISHILREEVVVEVLLPPLQD